MSVESITVRPDSIKTAPAVVLIADIEGRMALYPLPMDQANALRLSLGTPLRSAESTSERTDLLTEVQRIATVRSLLDNAGEV